MSVLAGQAQLKIARAWEEFIEDTFLLYLTGTLSANGLSIIAYASPPSRVHAGKMVRGIQPFVKWNSHDAVRTLSKIYFYAGEPYETALGGIALFLSDLQRIRNATAHLTSTTQSALEAVATRRLGAPAVGITVEGLLLSSDPGVPGQVILQTFVDALDAAADQVANP